MLQLRVSRQRDRGNGSAPTDRPQGRLTRAVSQALKDLIRKRRAQPLVFEALEGRMTGRPSPFKWVLMNRYAPRRMSWR